MPGLQCDDRSQVARPLKTYSSQSSMHPHYPLLAATANAAAAVAGTPATGIGLLSSDKAPCLCKRPKPLPLMPSRLPVCVPPDMLLLLAPPTLWSRPTRHSHQGTPSGDCPMHHVRNGWRLTGQGAVSPRLHKCWVHKTTNRTTVELSQEGFCGSRIQSSQENTL